MTKQEIFNKVRDHLLAQGKAAKGPLSQDSGNMTCMYRAPDGSKCAIGCLIPDDKYFPEMEGGPFQQFTHILAPALGIQEDDLEMFSKSGLQKLLSDLMWVHDNTSPLIWAKKLEHVADQNGLQIT